MFRNMVTSLFKHDRIRTTDAKAKELRRWADNMITLAKRGDLHARRQALAIVRERAVVHKLFKEAEDRFGSTPGGYTRIVRLGRRPGDAAPISLIELVSETTEKKKRAKKKKKSAAPEKKPTAAKPAAEQRAEQTSPPQEDRDAAGTGAPPEAAADGSAGASPFKTGGSEPAVETGADDPKEPEKPDKTD